MIDMGFSTVMQPTCRYGNDLNGLYAVWAVSATEKRPRTVKSQPLPCAGDG